MPLIQKLKQTHPDWSITAYIRPTRSAETVQSELKVNNVVTGEFGDFDKIKTLSKEHDIIVNAGNSFTGDPVTAVVAGLKQRPSDSKGKLIHISGKSEVSLAVQMSDVY